MAQTNFRSCVIDSFGIAEQIVKPNLETCFAVRHFDSEAIREEPQYTDEHGVTWLPFPTNHPLFVNSPVAFSTEIVTAPQTLDEIATRFDAFLAEHVDMDERFRVLVANYLVYTYFSDEFDECVYLHILGDYGTGKTRLGRILSYAAYKCLRSSGAATSSPIFRTLDYFRGALWLDEFDFTIDDDRTSDLIRILNQGSTRDTPYLRTEEAMAGKGKVRYATPYHVYGPKIITGRTALKDNATESRCFRIYLERTERHLREAQEQGTTPITGRPLKRFSLHFSPAMREELQEINNHLTARRLLHWGTHRDKLDADLVRPGWSPRLTQNIQLFMPFVLPEHRETVLTFGEEMEKAERQVRSGEFVAAIVEAIMRSQYDLVSMGEIADDVTNIQGLQNKLSARRAGSIIRSDLHLETRKEGGTNRAVLSRYDNKEKLRKLCSAHDIEYREPPKGPTQTAITDDALTTDVGKW